MTNGAVPIAPLGELPMIQAVYAYRITVLDYDGAIPFEIVREDWERRGLSGGDIWEVALIKHGNYYRRRVAVRHWE